MAAIAFYATGPNHPCGLASTVFSFFQPSYYIYCASENFDAIEANVTLVAWLSKAVSTAIYKRVALVA